jgi:hypothetical protein
MNTVNKSRFRKYVVTVKGYDVVLVLGAIYYLLIFLYEQHVLNKTDRGIAIIVFALTIGSALGLIEVVLKNRVAPDHGFYQFIIAMRKLSEFCGYIGMAYLSWLGLTWTYHYFF